MKLIQQIRHKAKISGKRIVFPETNDLRTLKAATFLAEEGLVEVVLLGDFEAAKKLAKGDGFKLSKQLEWIQPGGDPKRRQYAELLVEKRKHKGLTLDQALEQMGHPVFYAAAMVNDGRADGCVAGAVHTTGEVMRAALFFIGVKPSSTVVSSVFLMSLPDGGVFTFGDCAVVPYPDEDQLAGIAVDSAETHRKLTGQEPQVAMLSFSTKGSAKHPQVDLVRNATQKAQAKNKTLSIDGELQFDAAFVPEIGKRKAPNSRVAGNANVFIFPNLDAGNISYKITERLAGATATGPIIQGLNKPMNDLSRGCSWEDIVNTACVCALLD